MSYLDEHMGGNCLKCGDPIAKGQGSWGLHRKCRDAMQSADEPELYGTCRACGQQANWCPEWCVPCGRAQHLKFNDEPYFGMGRR
jgi:hypothetical protein